MARITVFQQADWEAEQMTDSRRDFLSGRALRRKIEETGDAIADEMANAEELIVPTAGDTVRLATQAMACEFSVIMNPGPRNQVIAASDALELLHPLENLMTVYRAESELSRVNSLAATEPVTVEPDLFRLLLDSRQIAVATEGAFDPTTGPLISLWRDCRGENRIPTDEEISTVLKRTGIALVDFDEDEKTVRFATDGVELNLGGIGKGHALDQMAAHLADSDVESFLLHGGRSSLLARGDHHNQGGWPVGIGNPLFTKRRFGTVLLKDCALSTSGSNIQFYRHAGRRYGHILNPQTGRPVEDMLSVIVLAKTAAEADALSTAFFVMGVEKTATYCDNCDGVGAIIILLPKRGHRLEPVVCGLPDDVVFLDPDTPERIGD